MKRHTGSAILRLLSVWSEMHAWEFVMPKTIHGELDAGGVPLEIENLLNAGAIKVESCSQTQTQLLVTKHRLHSLDDGELEAICIVDKCENRTFKNYLILTDDVAAQKGARKIGMSSLDVLMFLLLSNQEGLLTKDAAMNAVEILEKFEYRIRGPVREDYLNQMK